MMNGKLICMMCVCCLMAAGTLCGCGGSKQAATAKKDGKGGTAFVANEEMLKADCLMIDAKTKQEIGYKEEAKQGYRSLIAKYPNYAAAYYELGGVMQKQGYTDSALLLTKKAADLDKTNVWYKLQLTEIYEYQQDYKKLCECWEEIVRLEPNVLEHYYELSNAYVLDNDGEKAIKALDRIEKRFGIIEEVSLQQKEIWEAMGRHDMAVKEIEQLAKAMPQSSKYAAMMAEVYMKKKDYSKAKEYYDQILKNHPDDELIHFSLANYYQITGNKEKALAELEYGLKQEGLFCNEKLHVLGSFFGGNKLTEQESKRAVDLTAMLAEECPEDPEVVYFYGRLLVFDEQYGKAAEVLKRCVAQDSGEYETWELLLVSMDAARSDPKEIVGYARRAASLFPLHTLPNYLVGMYALMDKNYAEAKKMLLRCESMGFKKGYLEKQTYALLGDCYYWLKEYDKAWRYFDKCLRIDSTDLGTLNNYAYFLSEQDVRLEQAERMSKKTIEAEPNNATFLDTYAWILHKLGRDKEALSYMEHAMKYADDDRETLKEHLKIIKAAATK